MRIGDLRHRIELQSVTRTADGMGGFTESWATVSTVWAAIWPNAAKEVLENQQLGLNVTHRIRIRYHATVTAAWRIKFGTRYFNIVSILNPNEQNRLLDLICEEAAS